MDVVVIEPSVDDPFAEAVRLRSVLEGLKVPIDVIVFGQEEARRRSAVRATVVERGYMAIRQPAAVAWPSRSVGARPRWRGSHRRRSGARALARRALVVIVRIPLSAAAASTGHVQGVSLGVGWQVADGAGRFARFGDVDRRACSHGVEGGGG